jgi:hypothetical protein
MKTPANARVQVSVIGAGECGDIAGWRVRLVVLAGARKAYIGTFGPYPCARKSEAARMALCAADRAIRSASARLRGMKGGRR